MQFVLVYVVGAFVIVWLRCMYGLWHFIGAWNYPSSLCRFEIVFGWLFAFINMQSWTFTLVSTLVMSCTYIWCSWKIGSSYALFNNSVYLCHSVKLVIISRAAFMMFSCLHIQKSYETKQYKKGLKAADSILKKFPEHGGMQNDIFKFLSCYFISCNIYLVTFTHCVLFPCRNLINERFDAKLHGSEIWSIWTCSPWIEGMYEWYGFEYFFV